MTMHYDILKLSSTDIYAVPQFAQF